MAKKKSKTGKIILTVLGLLLVGGAVATITAGALTDWTFGLNDPFSKVKIESQEVIYDGTAKSLSVEIPEGADVEVSITKDGEPVEECVEIGVYRFTYKITIDEVTKEYVADLTIVEPDNQVETDVEAKNLSLKLSAVMLAEDGTVTKEFTYTITPENATNQSINVSVAWAENDSSATDDDSFKNSKTVTDYVTISKDEAQKKITLTCKQAFGSQVIANISSVDNPEATASVKVEYRKKRTYTYENVGQTLSSSVTSVEDLLNFTYSDSVGTLPFNGDAEDVLTFQDGTINSSVSSSFTGYTSLMNALNKGTDFSAILDEVNALESSAYNSITSVMNAHKTDLITRSFIFSNADANTLSGSITYGVDLGSTTIKVTDITISDDSIEF